MALGLVWSPKQSAPNSTNFDALQTVLLWHNHDSTTLLEGKQKMLGNIFCIGLIWSLSAAFGAVGFFVAIAILAVTPNF